MTLRFGTDGVRGSVFTELTPQFVASLGRAAAAVLPSERWLIGRDTRESGPSLSAAFAAGVGVEVHDLGVQPTPAVAFWSQRLGLPAAVITASHNPWSDNGVKIFAPGGLKLTDELERAIEGERNRHGEVALAPAPILPGGPRVAGDEYLAHVSDGIVPLSSLRVLLDCANGAMSSIAAEVFEQAGAAVAVINDAPNGRNINDHCGAASPAALAAAVLDRGADVGLAFDGDGDRVIAVDHLGNVVDGDRMLALAALQLRDAGQLVDDTVVVTVMSNLGLHRAMRAAGIAVVATAVGDRSVLEALDAGGYALGGEQSGHIIYRHLATTGDGLLAGLRLAQDVIVRGRPLAELAGEVMTSYPQVLLNVRVAERHPRAADELADDIAVAEAALGDEGRVLVRSSGTEPVIRVMVEAVSTDLASSTAQRLAAVVSARFG